MTQHDSWLALERFDSSPLTGRWAVVRMVAAMGAELEIPAGAKLVVERGTRRTTHGPFVSAADRRGSELLWLASFAIPLDVVQHTGALFELMAPGRPVVGLPLPGELVLPASCRAQLRVARRVPRLQVGRRATALAATLAVTATTIPTTGFALAKTSHALVDRRAAEREALLLAAAGQGPLARIALPKKHHRHNFKGNAIATPDAPSRKKPGARSGSKPSAPVTPPAPALGTGPAPATVTQTPDAHRQPKPDTHKHPKPHAHKRSKPDPKKHPEPAAKKPSRKHPAKPRHHRARPTGGAPISSGPVSVLSPTPALAPTREPENEASQSSSTAGAGTSVQLTSAPPQSLLSLQYANTPGPPPFLIPIYKAAQRRYHVQWQVLAAVNSIETNYGRDVSVSSAGAEGWMQFMPATWAQWGVDANHDGKKDPYNPRDAIFAAARYLRANGAPRDLRKAIFAYNHAGWYVDDVMRRAQAITAQALLNQAAVHVHGPAGKKIRAMKVMVQQLMGLPYVWGGGHGGWQLVSGYDCSGFVSAVLHVAGYLSAPQTTATLPSQRRILPGPGKYVTIYDRVAGQGHVIININGTFYESGGSAAGGGGAGVKQFRPPISYLASFDTILHPQGL
jgi:cell wall-associated NlpC family hydrolase